MVTKSDVFEDIAVAMESWVDVMSEVMTSDKADLAWVEAEQPYRKIQDAFVQAGLDRSVLRAVLSEFLRGFAVSMLTMFDGGSALAEKGRVYLIDNDGLRIGEGLHDAFVEYLLDSGRLK